MSRIQEWTLRTWETLHKYDTNVMLIIVNSERNLVMKLVIAIVIGDVHDSWTEAEEKGVVGF